MNYSEIMKNKKIEVNAKAIREKLALSDDRRKVSLYLSLKLYRTFKKVCGKAPASRVMEELMMQFIESAQE